jgi:hypothetical protein
MDHRRALEVSTNNNKMGARGARWWDCTFLFSIFGAKFDVMPEIFGFQFRIMSKIFSFKPIN